MAQVIYPDRNARRSDYYGFKPNELLISSIFLTLQGEGPFAGRRAVFVRLSGCNLGGKSVNGPGCPFCFEGNAMVKMGDGSAKPIKKVKKGDRVASYDTERRRYTRKYVTRTYVRQSDDLVRVACKLEDDDSGHIICTPEHPFYDMDSHQWVTAAEIATKHIEPKSSYWKGRINYTGDSIPVYNLEVEGTHTYIVQGHIVHNCDTDFRLSHSDRMNDDEIVAAIRAEHPCIDEHPERELIVITGGEPLLQKNITTLIERLHHEWPSLDIQIESNGTQWAEVGDAYLVLSPKVPETPARSLGYGNLSKAVWERANCLKVLISAHPDSPYYDIPDFARRFAETGRPVYLSPINVYRRTPDATSTLFDGTTYDLDACRRNHERAAKLCVQEGFVLSVQEHLLAGLA